MCYPVIVPLFLVVDGGAEVCGREERLAVEGVLWQVAGDGHAVQGAALGPGPVLPAPPAPHTGGEDSERGAGSQLLSPGPRVPHPALARPRHAVAGLARDDGLAAVARALGRHLPHVSCSIVPRVEPHVVTRVCATCSVVTRVEPRVV